MATLSDDVPARGHGSLIEGFGIQTRVIFALIMRELHTRYGRENVGYLWLILEPMLLATVIGLIHARGATTHRGDIQGVPLALIGYCNFMTFRSIFNRAEGAIEQNLPLMYHRTVKPFDILVSRALLETAGSWVAFFILMGAAVAVGLTHLPERPAFLLMGMIAMALLAFGLSMVVCGLTHERRSVGRLIHPISYILMPLSGAFFTMSSLPKMLQDFFLWVPLVHVFEIVRYGWFISAKDTYFSLWYLGSWLLGAWFVGLLMLSEVRKRIHMP